MSGEHPAAPGRKLLDALTEAALARDREQFPEWWKHVPDSSWSALIAQIVYRRAYIQGRADGVEVIPRMVGRLLEGEPRSGSERAS